MPVGLVAACRPPQRIPARIAQLLRQKMGPVEAAVSERSARFGSSNGSPHGGMPAATAGTSALAHLVQACWQLNAAQQLTPGVQHQAQVAIKQQLPRG